MIGFLAQQKAPQALSLSGGFSWWQTLGGLILVFGLLLLCLRLLGRLQRSASPSPAKLLAVWSVGPKREIQVLRLADEVHYIYRHDGAMVLLKHQDLAAWEQSRAAGPVGREAPSRWHGWLPWKFNRTAASLPDSLQSATKS